MSLPMKAKLSSRIVCSGVMAIYFRSFLVFLESVKIIPYLGRAYVCHGSGFHLKLKARGKTLKVSTNIT